MNWKPILTDELKERAIEAVRTIADALSSESLLTSNIGASYSGGHSGIALFYGYLAVAGLASGAGRMAEAHLEKAMEEAMRYTSTLGFFGGLAGVAWSSQHIERLLMKGIDLEVYEEVDGAIADAVSRSPWPWEYDLIYGLGGIACYILDHPRRSFAEKIISQIVDRLIEKATRTDEGITWFTDPRLMISRTRERYPNGYFDLGVAHGVAGLIGVLSRVHRMGYAMHRTRHLLESAIGWILLNKRGTAGGSTFSYFTTDKETSCRSAWCYGDPGVSFTLLSAARALGELKWELESIAIARKDCGRPDAEKGVVDAGLCHGSAGLGHLYNRLYQATGEEVFGKAARNWLCRTLDLRRKDRDFGGYPSWWPETREWHPDPGFLTGAAGVGLALLAAVSAAEPSWDRPMLLS